MHPCARSSFRLVVAGPLSHMFQACHPLVKSDVQTALFLLPYLAVTAISQPNGHGKERVREEICYVLREGRTSKQGELCVTAVFSLLDTLKKWVEERIAALPGAHSPPKLHAWASKAMVEMLVHVELQVVAVFVLKT